MMKPRKLYIYIYIYFIFHFFFSLSGHLFQLGELTNLFVQSTFSTVNHLFSICNCGPGSSKDG